MYTDTVNSSKYRYILHCLDIHRCNTIKMNRIEQKGITFDHDFGYSLISPFLFPPKKKREEQQENELAKIVIKGHAFLLDR